MQEHILEACLSAFIKHGFANTTMSKIAQEAGIAKGTLYLYFDSKEELTHAITEVYFEKFKERIMVMPYFVTLNDFLKHIEKSLLMSDDESTFIPIFFEVFGSNFRSKPFMQKYQSVFDEIGSYYTHTLQLLIDNGAINKSINSKVLGRVLVSMFDGIALHKGFFKIDNAEHVMMVKESVQLFRLGLEGE